MRTIPRVAMRGSIVNSSVSANFAEYQDDDDTKTATRGLPEG